MRKAALPCEDAVGNNDISIIETQNAVIVWVKVAVCPASFFSVISAQRTWWIRSLKVKAKAFPQSPQTWTFSRTIGWNREKNLFMIPVIVKRFELDEKQSLAFDFPNYFSKKICFVWKLSSGCQQMSSITFFSLTLLKLRVLFQLKARMRQMWIFDFFYVMWNIHQIGITILNPISEHSLYSLCPCLCLLTETFLDSDWFIWVGFYG